MIKTETFSQKLLDWFDHQGRHDLPWQHNKTPYRVWVSEIMLQQTQVQTVIPYYEKFMASFPDVFALANASQDEVLSHWSGLGYYARGRNLHKAAQQVVQDFAGIFPNTLDGMMALPGIGRSTAGAILSIACQQRHPILDGNVKRVLCRYDAIESWSGEKETETKLWLRADKLTPDKRFDDYTQAIMDLGATVCKRSKPQCDYCPVSEGCLAKRDHKVAVLPKSKPKVAKPSKQVCVMVLLNAKRQVFLVQRPQTGIWGGLWSLPEVEPEKIQNLIKTRGESLSVEQGNLIKWPEFKHTFTHFHLWIEPIIVKQVEQVSLVGQWVTYSKALQMGLPAPIRKVIEKLESKDV